MINERDIIDLLYKKFEKEKYQLSNSFVYEWESDFYYKNSSGYSTEIEVKLSLQDFRADFKKIAKHNHIKAAFKKDKTYVEDYKLVYNLTKEYYNRRSRQTEVTERETRQSNKSAETF